MKKGLIFSSLALGLVLVLSGCGGASTSEQQSPADTGQPAEGSGAAAGGSEVAVVATDFNFDLSQTSFKQGEPVTFTVEGKEGVHGFQIQGTNVNVTVPQGKTETVTWTPEKAGEYNVVCSIPCGSGHADMVAKITVE